jgi:hypothetical protein
LHEEEERFLTTVLSTQRAGRFGLASEKHRPHLVAALHARRVELWNALLGAMRVKRYTLRPADGLPEEPFLLLLVDRHAWCRGLEASLPAGGEELELLRAALAGDAQRCPATAALSEVAGTARLHAGPLGAVVPIAVSNRPELYGHDTRRHEALFTFLGVERNSVRITDRDGPQARWSLAEWEASGICRDATGAARRITRVGIPGRGLVSVAEREDARYTHRIRTVFTQAVARRTFEACTESEGEQCIDGFAQVFGSSILPRRDLDALAPRDLADIEWSGLPPAGVDPCLPR